MATETLSEPQPPGRSPGRIALRCGVGLLVVAFVALLVYGLQAKAPNTGIDDDLAAQRSAPAPAFELAVLQHGNLGPALDRRLAPALADGHVALRELRGTPAVLNFWASWCIPCREEAPLLERAWRTGGRPGGVLFLGLDMQDLTGDARGFLHEFEIDYLNIRDPSNPVARRYGVTGVPETFFLSSAGRIVGHVIGVVTPQQLLTGMDAARSGRITGSRRGGDSRPIR